MSFRPSPFSTQRSPFSSQATPTTPTTPQFTPERTSEPPVFARPSSGFQSAVQSQNQAFSQAPPKSPSSPFGSGNAFGSAPKPTFSQTTFYNPAPAQEQYYSQVQEEQFVPQHVQVNRNPRPLEIKLADFQEEHVENILQHLDSSPVSSFLDTSITGAGKTIVECYLANALELTVIVVCNKAATSVWERELNKYGVPWITIVTYDSLSDGGYKNFQLFTRTEDPTETSKDPLLKFIYTPTNLLKSICAMDNILLIFDEVHKAKNKSQMSAGAIALSTYVYNNTNRRVIACLSASAFSEPESAARIMRVMDLYQSQTLIVTSEARGKNYQVTETGIRELVDLAIQLDPKATEQTISMYGIGLRNTKAYNQFARRLYVAVFRQRFAFGMKVTFGQNTFDGYYGLGNKFHEWMCYQAVTELRQMLEAEGISGTAKIAMIQKSIELYEYAMLGTLLRLTKESLSNPNRKVIVMLQRLGNLESFTASLANDKIPYVVYEGKTSPTKREENLNRFNAPNNDVRVIVLTTQTGAASISLHDTSEGGRFQRDMYITPVNGIIGFFQAVGRAARYGQTSEPNIRLVQSRYFPAIGVLNALAKKTNYLRESMAEASGESAILPGEYEALIELYENDTEDQIAYIFKEIKKVRDETRAIRESVTSGDLDELPEDDGLYPGE